MHIVSDPDCVVIKRPDYPQGRAGYSGDRDLFDWDGSVNGPLAKTALYVWCDYKKTVTQNILDSRYARYGITVRTTYDFLRRAIPAIFDEYEACMGRPMPLNLPMKRVYMWWLSHTVPGGGCERRMSDECPLLKTPHLIPAAEELVRRAG